MNAAELLAAHGFVRHIYHAGAVGLPLAHVPIVRDDARAGLQGKDVRAQLGDDYVEALWSAVTAEGDRDTTCAIIGGMLGCWNQMPAFPTAWLQQREPLISEEDLS